MPSYHLHTSNGTEEIYTGKHVELTVAQWASTETAHCITKQENYLLSHWHLQRTGQRTVPQGVPETQTGKPLCYEWPTQTPLQQAGYHTVWLSSICSYPNLWAVFNTCIIWTHYVAQCRKQVPKELKITLIVMERLVRVEISAFHVPHHGTFVRRML